MPSRSEVYKSIDYEREYQNIWNAAKCGGLHETGVFILLMEHYLAEARALESTRENGNNGNGPGEGSLDFVRKVTALGVACMEQNGAPRRD